MSAHEPFSHHLARDRTPDRMHGSHARSPPIAYRHPRVRSAAWSKICVRACPSVGAPRSRRPAGAHVTRVGWRSVRGGPSPPRRSVASARRSTVWSRRCVKRCELVMASTPCAVAAKPRPSLICWDSARRPLRFHLMAVRPVRAGNRQRGEGALWVNRFATRVNFRAARGVGERLASSGRRATLAVPAQPSAARVIVPRRRRFRQRQTAANRNCSPGGGR